MAVHLLYLILITITTTITNYSCGELFLRLPLTINPVVQDAITRRDVILHHFYNLNPQYYSRLTPAHMVVKLNESLTFVMSKSINGAVVLGVAAQAAGFTVDQLDNLESYSKWFVNVSLTEIRGVLKNDERYLLPLSVNITIAALQKLGLRALQKRYNVSLHSKITDPLHLSSATTFSGISKDWIRVVTFITKTNVERLAAKHQVTVSTLARAFKLTMNELYHVTLNELDGVLSTNLTLVDGSLEVLVATVQSSTEQSTMKPTTSVQFSTEKTSPTQSTIMTRKTTIIPTETVSTKNLDTMVVRGDPTKDNSSGETVNMALYIGLPAGLLLLLVASSTWCFRRKRRRSGSNNQEKKNNNNGDIKMDNFWLEKNELSSNHEEPRQEELRQEQFHVGSPSGVDSTRFKRLKYAPTSSTFSINTPLKIANSSYDFENDPRREIFV